MKHTFISRSLAIGCLSAVLVLCACGREDIVPTPSDGTITFGASSSWRNLPDTKTAYSGELLTVSGSRYERIDWVPGSDRVRIVSNAASTSGGADYADYAVQAVSGTNASGEVESPAALSPVSGGLKWSGEEQAHYFYALYPSPTMTSEYGRPVPEGYASVTMTTLEGTPAAAYSLVVPSSQPYAALVRDEANSLYEYKPDMNLAYMSAAAKANAGVYDGVSLQFRPLVSTYEFTVMAADASAENLTLTAVTLTSSAGYLSGSFTTTVGPDGSFSAPELGSDKSNTVSVPVPAGADRKALSQSDGIRVTLFALPVEPAASETLTLDLTFVDASNAEVHRTLPLIKTDNTPITLPAGMKLYIRSLGVPGDWIYYIDDPEPVTLTYEGGEAALHVSDQFKSYRTRNGLSEPVDFKLQYSTYDDETGTWSGWSDGLPDWLDADSPSSYQGSVSGEALTLEMDPQGNTAVDPHGDELKEDKHKKTDFDLSTFNVATDNWDSATGTGLRTTANCYVVQGYGTYKFPLVYGNGVTDGEVNPSAYTGTPIPDDHSLDKPYFLEAFRDHLDKDITSPYIATQLGTSSLTATLVWTDEPGLVTNVTTDGDYLTFEVPEATITQGNALVAVLAPDGKIAWSWHIWVTDHDLTQSVKVPTGYTFAPYNLGWCDGRELEKYLERKCRIRAVQLDEHGDEFGSQDHESAPAVVLQQAYKTIVRDNNPYYQWGRKDPQQASNGLPVDGTSCFQYKTLVHPDDYPVEYVNVSSHSTSVGSSIQEPYYYYFVVYSSGFKDWNTERTFDNLWNSRLTTSVEYGTAGVFVTKTIYDPSPVGFKVGPAAAFTFFPRDVRTLVPSTELTVAGNLFGCGLFLPAIGVRPSTPGAVTMPSMVDSFGWYITASLRDNERSVAVFNSYCNIDRCFMNFTESRTYGYSVRPVVDDAFSNGFEAEGEKVMWD